MRTLLYFLDKYSNLSFTERLEIALMVAQAVKEDDYHA